jgi:hypothetical protein
MKIGSSTPLVILSRVDGEGSPNATISHFEILRCAQDDVVVFIGGQHGFWSKLRPISVVT